MTHTPDAPTRFTGFPRAAFDFYAALAAENTREFWAGHTPTYQAQVRGPMAALLQEVEAEFGPGKIFRPHRDVRFSADKRPYKDHQGAYVETSTTCGYYVQVDADGLLLGGGWYSGSPDQVTRYREAVLGPAGAELERIVADLRAGGYQIGGERLKSRPRGVPADHPRVDLLRHRSLTMHIDVPCDTPWVGTPGALEHVRAGWRDATPLLDWLGRHATDPAAPGGS